MMFVVTPEQGQAINEMSAKTAFQEYNPGEWAVEEMTVDKLNLHSFSQALYQKDVHELAFRRDEDCDPNYSSYQWCYDHQLAVKDHVIDLFYEAPTMAIFNKGVQTKVTLKKELTQYSFDGRPIEKIFTHSGQPIVKRAWQFYDLTKENLMTLAGLPEPMAMGLADGLIWKRIETVQYYRRNGSIDASATKIVADEDFVFDEVGNVILESTSSVRSKEAEDSRQIVLKDLETMIGGIIIAHDNVTPSEAQELGKELTHKYSLDILNWLKYVDYGIIQKLKDDTEIDILDYQYNGIPMRVLIGNKLKRNPNLWEPL